MKEKKEKSKKKEFYNLGSLRLQVGLVVLSVILLFLFFLKPVVTFHSEDVCPDIAFLTPKQIVELGSVPSVIDVGIHIRNFSEYDVTKERFIVDMKVWFQYDPKLVSLNSIGKFTFDKARVIRISEPEVKIVGDQLLAEYDIRVEFKIPLNYKNFPLDDHRLSFVLTNYSFLPSEVLFRSSRSNLQVSGRQEVYGWRLVSKSVQTGYDRGLSNVDSKVLERPSPRVIFFLDYSRLGVRLIISIIAPLILIFFIALFTLCIASGTTISVAMVTGIIAHRFVIENMSPKTGYFMFSDNLFVFTIVACAIIFVVNIFGERISYFYKNLLAIFMHIALWLLFFYSLYDSLWGCF